LSVGFAEGAGEDGGDGGEERQMSEDGTCRGALVMKAVLTAVAFAGLEPTPDWYP
jgi:hypothetical protein